MRLLLLLRHIPLLSRYLNKRYHATLIGNMEFLRVLLDLDHLDVYEVGPKPERVEDTEYSVYPHLKKGLKAFEFIELFLWCLDKSDMRPLMTRCLKVGKYGHLIRPGCNTY